MFSRTPTLCGILAISALFASRVSAQMTLTPVAVTAGFSLSTFATGFPSGGGVGPVGITFTPSGGVLVSNYGSGNLYRFATDTDGQTLAMASNSTFYGGGNVAGLATTGGKYYMVQQQSGQVIQVNENTTFNHVVISGLNSPLGLVTNPANGHLLASVNGSGKIIDINPATGVAADVITGLPDVDGISISADGSVVFAAVRGNGHLQGYNIATHALTFDAVVPNLDGTVAGTGTLDGNIFANTTSGNLVEINLLSGIQTLIGFGGSRGDFVSADPNGTLLVTQTDRILRLTAPSGGGFGSSVPEPGSMALLIGLGGTGISLALRKYGRKSKHC